MLLAKVFTQSPIILIAKHMSAAISTLDKEDSPPADRSGGEGFAVRSKICRG